MDLEENAKYLIIDGLAKLNSILTESDKIPEHLGETLFDEFVDEPAGTALAQYAR